MKSFHRLVVPLFVVLIVSSVAQVPADPTVGSRNKADRLEQFRDLGFGLFIHWSYDSQLGSVISHSLVGADEAYTKKFIEELPKTFNPQAFAPTEWASLAKLAGIRYVMFTAKHHSGFCMWPTATTDFDIKHTPFHRDPTREILEAFKAQGIRPGLYFSPDDFWWLHKNGITIQRQVDAVQPRNLPGLMAHDKAQIRELLTQYGPIDMFFFDGEAEGLRDLAWDLQPDVVVTRGAIRTPEQSIPGFALDEAWEACMTMGTQWQYKPTNEVYKSGGTVISLLVETRAKGGNFLLNVGPKPNGELPLEQEERLREVALWMFINSECIYAVRPWVITNEGDVWFTKSKDGRTVYAVVKTPQRWPYGEWRNLVLKSVRATPETRVSVLGQSDQVLEYSATVPQTTWEQQDDGLHVRAMRAVRIYNDRKWPNPVVLKITNVEPALLPPRVETIMPHWDGARQSAQLTGRLLTLGDAKSVEVSFEYSDVTGLDLTERLGMVWQETPVQTLTASGEFTHELTGFVAGHNYEIRTVVKHPLLTLYGQDMQLKVP